MPLWSPDAEFSWTTRFRRRASHARRKSVARRHGLFIHYNCERSIRSPIVSLSFSLAGLFPYSSIRIIGHGERFSVSTAAASRVCARTRCVCARGCLAGAWRMINICPVNEWEADCPKKKKNAKFRVHVGSPAPPRRRGAKFARTRGRCSSPRSIFVAAAAELDEDKNHHDSRLRFVLTVHSMS